MNADEMMDWTQKAAKQIYMEGQEVRPVLWLKWPGSLAGVFLGMGHPADVAAQVLLLMGRAFPYEWIGLTVESWTKSVEGVKPEDVDMPRGTLARMSETDPTVHTALVTTIIDAKDVTNTKMRMATNLGDPTNPEWDVHDMEGPLEGYLYDALVKSLTWSQSKPPPPEIPFEKWVSVLGSMGLMGAAMIYADDDIQSN